MKNSNLTVTVAEGIAMVANLHAQLGKTEVKERENPVYEYRFDFDDPSVLVDLTKRNQRNNNGVSFNRGAKGEVNDSALTVVPAKSGDGKSALLQLSFNGLELAAKDYNKISLRMKIDLLEETTKEEVQDSDVVVYFKTNTASNFSEARSLYTKLDKIPNVSEWFELELEAGENENWKDYITSIRLDTPGKYASYSIDYVVFSKSEKSGENEWYNKYVDYVVDNGIADKYRFVTADYDRNMTRAEFCELVAGSVGEELLSPINNTKGIPDVDKNRKNADVYLSLYRAGVLKGTDKKGSFCPDADIRMDDAMLVCDRILDPAIREKTEISADWTECGTPFDVEFENDSEKYTVTGDVKLSNSVLTLDFDGADEQDFEINTPKIELSNVDFDAKDYTKLRIRIKPEFDVVPERTHVGLYFNTEKDSEYSDERYMFVDYIKDGTVDAQGWYVAEIDFKLYYQWEGRIKALRVDAVYGNGTFSIDYIRLVKTNPLYNLSHEELTKLGYVSNGMLQDTAFERGFNVQHFEQKRVDPETRRWQDYCETYEKPLWDIGPWWCLYDLWDNRDKTVDKYTLTDDKGINTVKVNPVEKSLLMRVNATKIYNGEPHDVNTYRWWPHLLLNQHYHKYPVDKVKNNAGADRVFLEMDIRMPDFKNTINAEGANSCAFLLYFYFITDKAPSEKIWYGFTLFNCNHLRAYPGTKSGWAPDSAAHQYMYGTPQATVYGGIENSFNPEPGVALVGDEWKHIRLDITEHIERCVAWANRDKAFGLPVEKKDMYFGGCNIGFEIHGNYDCTFEFKNLDMIAYNKKEK